MYKCTVLCNPDVIKDGHVIYNRITIPRTIPIFTIQKKKKKNYNSLKKE